MSNLHIIRNMLGMSSGNLLDIGGPSYGGSSTSAASDEEETDEDAERYIDGLLETFNRNQEAQVAARTPGLIAYAAERSLNERAWAAAMATYRDRHGYLTAEGADIEAMLAGTHCAFCSE